MLEHGACVDARTPGGCTPLMSAALKAHANENRHDSQLTIEKLIAANSDLNAVDEKGNTAIMQIVAELWDLDNILNCEMRRVRTSVSVTLIEAGQKFCLYQMHWLEACVAGRCRPHDCKLIRQYSTTFCSRTRRRGDSAEHAGARGACGSANCKRQNCASHCCASQLRPPEKPPRKVQCWCCSKQVHSLLLGTVDVSCALAGANHLIKDENNKTALDYSTGPLRRLLLKNCGKVKVASAAAVALAVKAEAELLALLETESQAAQQPKKKKKKGGKKKQQQPQPKQKPKAAVVVKHKAAAAAAAPAAPAKLIQPPRVLCEIAVNLHQAELPSKPSKHHLVVPLQECSSRLVTSVRPAPIVTSNKMEVSACTVLANSAQTIEESEHQRSMQQLRMELEAAHQAIQEHQSCIQEHQTAHQSSMQQLRTQLAQVTQEHQGSMQQLESQSKLDRQEIDHLRAKTECAVCLDGERNAVLFPCMHASCCHKCSASLEQCPQCRSPVTQMLRIYSP